MNQTEIEQLTASEVKAELATDSAIKLLDVRGVNEAEIASIEGAELVTETLAEEMLASWPKETKIIFHCHHGFRSQQACEYFQAQGFSCLRNMAGGIDAWSVDVDSRVPRY